MGAHLQHGSHALGAEDADGGLAVRSLAEQKQSPGHKGVSRTAPRPLAWGTRRLCSPLGTAPWKSDKPGTNTRPPFCICTIELAKVPKGSWLLRGWRLWSLRRWRVEGGDGHCDSILSAPCASGPRGLHGTAPQGLRARRRETDLPCLYSLSRDGVGHTRAGIRHPVRCPAPLPSSPPRAGRPLHGFDLLGRCLPAHALKSLALCTGEIGGA